MVLQRSYFFHTLLKKKNASDNAEDVLNEAAPTWVCACVFYKPCFSTEVKCELRQVGAFAGLILCDTVIVV